MWPRSHCGVNANVSWATFNSQRPEGRLPRERRNVVVSATAAFVHRKMMSSERFIKPKRYDTSGSDVTVDSVYLEDAKKCA